MIDIRWRENSAPLVMRQAGGTPLPKFPVTDTPQALPGTVANTVYWLQNSGGMPRLFFDIVATGSPPDPADGPLGVLRYADREFVSHAAGEAIFVWADVPGPINCSFVETAG